MIKRLINSDAFFLLYTTYTIKRKFLGFVALLRKEGICIRCIQDAVLVRGTAYPMNPAKRGHHG